MSISFSDAENLSSDLHLLSEDYFMKRGETMAISLYADMVENVSAYRDYLSKQGFNFGQISRKTEFNKIPTLDKATYLRQYSRKELCRNGDFDKKSWVYATTSGSTGEPFYFPRLDLQDKQYALTAELYLRENFKIHQRKTLYIVAFPMGAWIGGLFTYEALHRIAVNKNYSLSIITPGINKIEVIKVVQNLGEDYDQIIIGSYAPFLKDIIDDGIRSGINWSKYKLGFVFSAEAFSEEFRDYVARKTGLESIYLDTLNHYGTVDLGTMAHETPIAILIRRLAIKSPALYTEIFGATTKLPTLAQYLPEMFYFEEIKGNLVCTADSGIPLVRYELNDRGGIISFSDMEKRFLEVGLNLREEAENVGISDTIWNLPFVFVYERADFSVSFFAFQVYPETVRKVLDSDKFADLLTGKFTMMVNYDKAGRQHLDINVELKPSTEASETLGSSLTDGITRKLILENSEYRRTYEEYGDQIAPRITFWPYEDNYYFKPGTKQKWVKK